VSLANPLLNNGQILPNMRLMCKLPELFRALLVIAIPINRAYPEPRLKSGMAG